MYSLSVSRVKSHRICSRMPIVSGSRVKKFTSSSSLMDKIKKRKELVRSGARKIFGKYLLLTNTISSGFLMAIGDLIQQQIELVKGGKDKSPFDWKRNVNMGIVGTFQGPFAHFFYQILDRYFPGVKMTTIMKKILLDQTIASPMFIFIFFGGMNYLEKRSFQVTKSELKEKFWVVYAVDCSVWIPAQFFNFYCLSSKYRVIYINLLTMCYNVFLSFIKHNALT